jgi:hypothetical protein
MKLSDCGDCPKKEKCLIPDENKTWLHAKPDKETRLVMAVEVLKVFGLEGIDYKINTNGKIDFNTEADKERASEIIGERLKPSLNPKEAI